MLPVKYYTVNKWNKIVFYDKNIPLKDFMASTPKRAFEYNSS